MPKAVIAFEGLDGSGKSTQLTLLRRHLEFMGLRVGVSGPFISPFGRRVRELFLQHGTGRDVGSCAQLCLLAAAMRHAVDLALATPQDVTLLDRFALSTYAYHGGGLDVDHEIISRIYTTAIGDFRPNLTILLDIDLSHAAARRGPPQDRVEAYSGEFFARVRAEYLRLAFNDTSIKVVDASAQIVQVHKEVRRHALGCLHELQVVDRPL